MTGPSGLLSYRVVLPPGWARIALRGDAAGSVDAILERSFAGLPTDKYGPMRSELRKTLLKQIETARENQGVDLYLPVETMHGVAIPASFLVAVLPFDSVQEPPAASDLLAAYAAELQDATLTEVDSAPAVRSRRLEAGVEGAQDGTQFPSRRIDYLISIPEGADNWLTISFSTIGDGDPDSDFTALMVELFDSIIATFRWVHEPPSA